MENGVDWRIGEKFSGLTSPDLVRSTGTDDSDLLQVMKAVEAAEVTIKQQVEENIRLRSELEYKTLELHRRKQLLESSSPMPPRSSCLDPVGSHDELLRAPNSETSSQPEGEYDHLPRVDDSGEEGLMQLNHSGENKSVVEKIYENEREIMQLRRQLVDYSIKEAKIRNEKYVLESRIANMRLVFDQQQHDLADAASKAMVYRQDILEENIRLAYALQDVQQERSAFVSALLPILTDYSLQPQGHDAQSIASNVKILFRHLQEKLIMTESRLKQFQYQVRPLQSNSNQSSISNTQQSPPSHSIGAALEISNKDRLEMVTQPPSSHEKAPASPPAAAPQTQPAVPAKPTIARLDANRYRDDTPLGKQVKFREPEMQTNIDYDDHEEEYNESGGTSPYYPSPSYSRFLSPVHEDLFLEDDLLPAIEGLQISGEALPGHELQASGYSINGTTSCNFEWVRHLPDGSVNYIEGAKQPNYLLTADDVNTYLAIEVQPLDDRKRKGELVKVFANDHKKITCDPEMQSQIQKILQKGHGSFKVFEFTGFLDIWEPATLAIKRGSYSIKRSSEPSVVAAEKFSPNTFVSIPYGSPSEFMITDSDISGVNADHLLKTDDSSSSRDTLVLILRLFILRAVERRTRKGKKRVLFF
ncbi:PREDICTED: uncharacterized protein LOC101312614 [Fragaria vesca subsp. vesca]|uniref:uncharacterized protein LOC101312614 n=1 Tax=Fragaria vesca subsp. vesca TaxID=101020 RepID=UPI0002C36793|nr:PREDICTED: uncharacterized protein LOC101312614 [Fragaria vesca subsp. vesca]